MHACVRVSVVLLLMVLLFFSTHNKFDQLCGVRVTEQVVTQLSSEGVELLLDRLTSLLCQPSQLTIDTM